MTPLENEIDERRGQHRHDDSGIQLAVIAGELAPKDISLSGSVHTKIRRRTSAIANSFQVETKSRISSAARTGRQTGRKMRRKMEVGCAVDQRGWTVPSAGSLKKPQDENLGRKRRRRCRAG